MVERHLIQDLAANTLSPQIVSEMNDEEVAFITAEPQHVTNKREYLEGQKAVLEEALSTIREFVGA